MANSLSFPEIADRLKGKGYEFERRGGQHDIYRYQVQSTANNWNVPVGRHRDEIRSSSSLFRCMAHEAGLSIPQFRSFLDCGRRGKPLKKCLDYECAASAEKKFPEPHPQPERCPERFARKCPVCSFRATVDTGNSAQR